MDAQQILQAGLVVVVVGELEDRLLAAPGQPEDRPPRHPLVPGQALLLERADQPRGADAGERPGRRLIEDEESLVVLLQEGGGHMRGDLALDGQPDDLRLVLAPRHEDHPAGAQDRAHAHRQRGARRLLVAAEIARRIAPGERIEGDQAGGGSPGAARLVEADVPGAADAQDLEIEAAGLADQLLVAGAAGVDLRLRRRVPSGTCAWSGGRSTWSNRCVRMKLR